MTTLNNVIAFPTSRVLPVSHREHSDSLSEAPRLRRPRMLLQAARHGQSGYRRNRDLRRLMHGAEDLPIPGQAVAWLTAREARMDEARRQRTPEWDLQTHILLLIALLAELRLTRAATRPAMPTGQPQVMGADPIRIRAI